MLLSDVFGNRVLGQDPDQQVQVSQFPKIEIAKLSELKDDSPLEFSYPSDGLHTGCLLIKLGRKAGGGVGAEQDIVAFSGRCTHMGGDLTGGYFVEHKLLGCDEHLSTFDLTRHGMMVAGHATEALPQIVLETEGDSIYATAITGLLYGHHQNPSATPE